MKFGPLHLIRGRTFRRLAQSERLWHHFSSELAAAGNSGNPLAARVLEHTHGLMHSPLSASFAPVRQPSGATAPRSRDAAERVVRAYHAAIADKAAPPAPSMWDDLTEQRRHFLSALDNRDTPAVQAMLERLFVSPLVHGLGQVHESHPALLAQPMAFLHYQFTDALVSLAEAVGAARVSCMAQDAPSHLRPLNCDLPPLYDALKQRMGFAPNYSDWCGAFGFELNGDLLTIDSLTHAYAAWRLAQLGAGIAETVYELGGGYGGLALMAHRAGIGRYSIFDLPWVNALQGYFLIINLPENAIGLCGETGGNYRVEPYWRLYSQPAAACTFSVNSDSLPEMGHATALDYLHHLRRVTARAFLSINQEAKAHFHGVGPQNCVSELVGLAGGFRLRSRQRHWLRQGYVEEVFEPAA